MLVHGEQGQNLVPKQERLSYQRHQCDSEPVNAPALSAPHGTRSHAPAAMQGSSAELMPTFLTLAVLLGEGEGRPRKEDRKGRVFAEMHKMDPLQPDFQSWTFKCISCPAHILKHSDHSKESHVGGRNDFFRRRKEKGEKCIEI